MADIPTSSLPGNITIPTNAPGPQFIDEASCRCALLAAPVSFQGRTTTEAWQCTGNGTYDLYQHFTAKWFMPTNTSSNGTFDTTQSVDWAGNPPNTGQYYIANNASNGWSFQTPKENASRTLLPIDTVCSGHNNTALSKSYYEAVNYADGKSPPLCTISKYAQALPLMNATAWNETGCLAGFYCPKNTADNPPSYCQPDGDCMVSKLTSNFCYTSQGLYQPSICQIGYYCPLGGKEQIICPVGSYCLPGSFRPTKCAAGAYCPQGSRRSFNLVPFGMLILLDLLLLIWYAAMEVLNRRRTANSKRSRGFRGAMKSGATKIIDLNQKHKRYHEIDDQLGDHAIALEARIVQVKRQTTGFLAAVENDWVYHEEIADDEKPGSDMQLLMQSMSKCIDGSSFGLSFEFEKLSFSVRKLKKTVLSEITGKINSGALWAVMGASGAGKSTFVNVLMGKQKHTGGVTKVNGVPGSISKYKRIIGYVPQDDIVLPELTVRENILHSARIRLPSSWTDSEIQHHVDVLISCLQLAHVKDSLVGSTSAPVISGGQRKRVSIGIELAAAPMALFLDEPTSGLDATSASSVMAILKSLSRLGMTVVTIIHQPRAEIFAELDSLILLGAGRMIYQGPTAATPAYFTQMGFSFPEHSNPADVLMDIIAGQGALYKRIGETSIPALISYWQNHSSSQSPTPDRCASPLPPGGTDTTSLSRSIEARGASFPKQTLFCLQRAILQQFRTLPSLTYELCVAALSGLLIGLSQMSKGGVNFKGLFLPPFTPLSPASDYVSVGEMALLVGVAIGLTASAPGVKVFGEEKLVYRREAESGHNRFAYYVGKVASTAPRMLLACFHFTTFFLLLSTPMIGWGTAFAANLAYFYTIYGLASVVGMLVTREDGPLLAVMASLVVGVLNGMSPRLASVEAWGMAWLWYLSPGTWLAEAYFTENVSPWGYLYILDPVASQAGYKLGRFGMDLGVIILLGTVYRVIAFLGLRFGGGGR